MSHFFFLRLRLRGASFTEYLIILGAVALVAVAVFVQFGDTNRRPVTSLSQSLRTRRAVACWTQD